MKQRFLVYCFSAIFLLLLCSCKSANIEETTVLSGETEGPITEIAELESDISESDDNDLEDLETPETEQEEEITAAEGEYSRELAKKNQEFRPESAELTEIRIDPQKSQKWTVMVYMIGSNLESALGAASNDIAEMADSGIDLSDKNLILYTGGSTRWQADIPCDRNCVIDLSKDPEERIAASTDGNADMGAKETLSNFVNFCTEYYPAEHYALIFWDHGGGPIWGYGADELFSGDGLLLIEMYQAMKETVFSANQKLDFVGFDACLMGCLENMSIWSLFADYYIGSEELEPGDGWDYHFLNIFNETDDPVQIISAVIDCFRDYYAAKQSEYFNPDLTLSAADLSAVRETQTALSDISKKLQEEVLRGNYTGLASARNDCKVFGLTGKADEEARFSYDLVDLLDYLEKLSNVFPDAAEELSRCISKLIIKNYSNMEHAGGVTLYYPGLNRAQYYETRENYSNLSYHQDYPEFLLQLSRIWQDSDKKDWVFAAPDREDGEYIIQLTEEQQEGIISCSYSILTSLFSEGQYVMMLSNCPVSPDDQGRLHLEADPKLLCLESGGREKAWPASIIEQSAKRTVYETWNSRLLSSGIHYMLRHVYDTEDISIIISEDHKKGKMEIKNVNSVSSGVSASGKQTVNVSDYDLIFNYYHEMIPTYTENGILLPFDEWREGDLSGSNNLVLDDSIGISMIPASESGYELYYLVSFQDAAGNLYVMEPVKIDSVQDYTIQEVPTDLGTLTYHLYEDHAELVDYIGTDKELVLPESVEGVPLTRIGTAFGRTNLTGGTPNELQSIVIPDGVTEIGANAFFNRSALISVRFPEKLESIGDSAFAYTGISEAVLPEAAKRIGTYAFSDCGSLTRVVLPQQTEHIGKGAFAMDPALTEIVLPAGNESYTIYDGALYSKDYKRLLAFPGGRTGSYTVHPDTEEIAPDSFSCTNLTEVILPEGLRSIGNYAFFAAACLHMPHLPESLERVGKYAFSANDFTLGAVDPGTEEQEISIGSRLEYIGSGAFAGVVPRIFTVHPDNPKYSEKDGALLSKAGDSLIEFPLNRRMSMIAPSGVCDIDISVMNQLIQYNFAEVDLYLPDSLIRITGSCRYMYKANVHCSEGSYAEECALKNDWTVTHDTEPVLSEYEYETENGVLKFDIKANHAVLTEYAGTDKEVTVPGEVQGVPVTVIGDGKNYLFRDLSSDMPLESFVIPDTVQEIASSAFAISYYTIILSLPDSITKIGDKAFCGGCHFAENRLPAKLESIGTMAFGDSGFDFQAELHIPETLTDIAPGAFAGVRTPEYILDGKASEHFQVRAGCLYSADGLTMIAAAGSREEASFVIPKGTEVIGDYAFYRSHWLSFREIEIPASVHEIGAYAFSYCSQITDIVFSEGLESIGEKAFYLCDFTKIRLPESCRIVGREAFCSCDRLEYVSLHCESIGERAFSGCEALQDIDFGNNLVTIGKYGFYDTGLKGFVLPDSLKEIGDYAFDLYKSSFSERLQEGETFQLFVGSNLSVIGNNAFGGLPISEFFVSSQNPYFAVVSGFLTDHAGKILLVCPKGLSGTVEIPDGITEIEDYSFYNCLNVDEVVIPDSVIVIHGMAFERTNRDEDGNLIPRFRCSPGSAAETYAVNNDWPLILIQ